MKKQAQKKFGWKIKNFSLECEKYYSAPVLIGDCKWRLLTYPKGNIDSSYLSMYVEVVDFESLPCGWGRFVKLRLTLVNKHSQGLSIVKEMEHCFEYKSTTCGFDYMVPLSTLHQKDSGFLVDGDVMILAELDVIEVVATLDETEKPAEASEIRSNMKDNEGAESSCLVNENNEMNETKQVNGFHVLPSQVESARVIFERHPDIALEFRAKNQHIRTTYMNFLLSLIETLCQPLEELVNEDLVEADIALTYLKDVGFKVDWLEKKLDQLKEKKEKELSCEARVKVMEAQLHDLKHKLETEKAELSIARAPLSFDDVV